MAMAFPFALDKAGSSMPARIAMIAITTNNSMSVNADLVLETVQVLMATYNLDVGNALMLAPNGAKSSRGTWCALKNTLHSTVRNAVTPNRFSETTKNTKNTKEDRQHLPWALNVSSNVAAPQNLDRYPCHML